MCSRSMQLIYVRFLGEDNDARDYMVFHFGLLVVYRYELSDYGGGY